MITIDAVQKARATELDQKADRTPAEQQELDQLKNANPEPNPGQTRQEANEEAKANR